MKDLYSEITNGIIEQLEQGVIPWKKPWTGRQFRRYQSRDGPRV